MIIKKDDYKKKLIKKTLLKIPQWEKFLERIPDFKSVLDFKSAPELYHTTHMQ